MAQVAVILPCYGRHEQTLSYAARMVAAAGAVDAAFYAVGGQAQHATVHALVETFEWIGVPAAYENLSYWHALDLTCTLSTEPIVCAVANDLWAGDRWLELGLAAYRERFEDGEGLMGFAGDGHPAAHSCHFLIGRRLLAALGGWPVHYRHNYGDTELCLRAQAMGRYGKATRAILEHRHPMLSTAPDDEVYAAGRANWAEDQALFEQRRAGGWV